MPEDVSLLQQYAQHGDENAFRQVVERHLALVYSLALRQLCGDAHMAQDVSQEVFLALARSAESVAQREVLTGWLCRTTRNLAANAVRAEKRRRVREETVAGESGFIPASVGVETAEADWQGVSLHLDDAMSTLSAADHDAILLRFFRQMDFREVGQELGVSDDTAQKRVSRALERLRDALCQRGVALSVAALGSVIASHAVSAVPPGLATTIVAGIPSSTAPVVVETPIRGWIRSRRLLQVGGAVVISCLLLLYFARRPPEGPGIAAVFDLASDFPLLPGDPSPWSPGWSATLGGKLRPLDFRKRVDSANGQRLIAWQVDEIGRPTFAKNVGAETAVSAGGAFVAPPGAVYLTAEVGDTVRKFGVVRFTTPPGFGGAYELTVAVQPIFLGASSGDTDFHILKNGKELFGRFLGPESGASYSNFVQLKAGDTVDFVVGQGRNRDDEGSTLRIEASLAGKGAEVPRLRSNQSLAIAPVILASPSDQGVLRGETATLDVLATGTPPLRYQWWHGGEPVVNGTQSVLRIASVQTNLEGPYHLVVSNATGSSTSAPARLFLVNCVPVPRNLAAWWRGEQDGVNPAMEQHSVSLAGTRSGPGRVGKGYVFAGAGAGIVVPASAAIHVGAADGFTFELWAKPDRTDGKIPLLGWNGTNSYGANLSIINGRLYANLRDAKGVSHTAEGDPATILVPGQWKHVALTFDSHSQSLRLFVNAYMVADTPMEFFHVNTTSDLQIGRRTQAGTVLTYSGVMDEISLYRRALAPEEIKSIVEAGSAGKCSGPVSFSALSGKE